MSEESKNKADDPFIAFLKRLKKEENRAALAALRRGLGYPPGRMAEMHPYVMPFLPHEGWTWESETYYIIAALFALCPEPGGHGNLGATYQRVFQDRGRAESIEKRFVAMLNCHRDDLAGHLRQAIGLARSTEVPVDWQQLHRDIRHWDHPEGFVQRNWARGFWGAARPAAAAERGE